MSDERIPDEMVGPLLARLIADAEKKLGRKLLDVEIETALAKVGIVAKVQQAAPKEN